MELFNKLKSLLVEKKCDYLYINHTNEFFSEYVDVSKSSRFLLTNFSGSMGDAVVSKDKIYLFVDSRYWQQAEQEVDINIVKVLKLGKDLDLKTALASVLKPKSKILFYDKKTSFKVYEYFETLGYKPFLTDTDYVEKYLKVEKAKLKDDFIEIPTSISGKSTEQKIAKLQNKLKDDEVLIVSSLEDVSYLLNLISYNFEYSSVIFGKIIITKDNFEFYTDERKFEKVIKKYSKNVKYLIDKGSLSIKYKKYFKNYEQAKVLRTLRSVKYSPEIKHMEYCFEKTDEVVKSVIESFMDKNYTEEGLYKYANQKFKEHSAVTNSFKTILASGKNSSIVHFSHPTKRKIEKGEFVLLDCGAFYNGGYATDITRTFLKGKPSNEQKIVYTIVLKAFLNAYNADLSKYKKCIDIDKIARDLINKLTKKYKLEGFTFGHGLGHSVGRCVHDGLPTISPSPFADMLIKKNMVFTIEPGLYKPNWGGVRLENTIHVVDIKGKLKFKSFSKAPFQRNLIDFSMLTQKEKNCLKEWELY